MRLIKSILPIVAVTLACPVWAAGPQSNQGDARIQYLEYRPNAVTQVRVKRGVVTRIMLERDEQILIPVVGLSSDCSSATDEWCISAIAGSNQIFIRPRDNSNTNNMELHTSKRDYSLVFQVVGGNGSHARRGGLDGPFFRVVFQYPDAKPLAAVLTTVERNDLIHGLLRRVDAVTAPPTRSIARTIHGMSPGQQLAAEGIDIRNANYSKQVMPKGDDADPAMVFDDGRFTYFDFPGSREIPAIFAHGSDGEPTRVNWHMNGSLVVVQRTARKFTVRLGDAVVGVFNESFDSTGADTPTSTVSPSVAREIKGGTQ